MSALRPHRMWIGLLALAVAVAAADAPLIGIAQQKESQKLSALRQKNATTTQALSQLKQDIAATIKLKNEILDADVEKFLAPTDRLKAAEIMEHRAAESHLTGFNYTLSPESKIEIDTPGSGKQNLASSRMMLTASAPTDLNIYQFFDALRRTLPGRMSLRSLTLERMGTANTPITATNLHMEAEGEWLSNGAGAKAAEGIKQ